MMFKRSTHMKLRCSPPRERRDLSRYELPKSLRLTRRATKTWKSKGGSFHPTSLGPRASRPHRLNFAGGVIARRRPA